MITATLSKRKHLVGALLIVSEAYSIVRADSMAAGSCGAGEVAESYILIHKQRDFGFGTDF